MPIAEHVPVLQQAAVAALQVAADGRYVDATYGRGGHSQLLLAQLREKGQLLVLDRDPDAVRDAAKRFIDEPRVTVVGANFADLDQVVEQQGWTGLVDGLLLDLGVSSPQLDVAERGFGFSRDGELDMRMDPESGESAADWLARVAEGDLVHVLKTYGDERYARRIAAAIVVARNESPLRRTGELAEVVKRAHPRWQRHHHPATRTFQAIRIQVNGELDAIKRVLVHARSCLRIGGRIVVISFHSLEDRLVKRALRKPPPNPDLPRHLPLPVTAEHPWRVIGKAIKANSDELALNPRARSAVLRVAERVA